MYRNDPRLIVAKYNGKCAETGKVIKKGDDCVFYPVGKKIYCLESKQYTKFKEWYADLQMGHDY